MISFRFDDEEMEEIESLLYATGDEKMTFYLFINLMHPINADYMDCFYDGYHSQRKEKERENA